MLKEAECTAWLIGGGFLNIACKNEGVVNMKNLKNLINDELVAVKNVHFLGLPNLRIKLPWEEPEIDGKGNFPSFRLIGLKRSPCLTELF